MEVLKSMLLAAPLCVAWAGGAQDRASAQTRAPETRLWIIGSPAPVQSRAQMAVFLLKTLEGSGYFHEIKLRKVAADRRIEVTSVSCSIGVTSPGVIANVRLRNELARGGSAYDYFAPTRTASDAGVTEFILNAQTFFFGNAGDTLYVDATGTDSLRWLSCKVAGELVTLQ
ncbi:MAG: hypothetical protein GEU91_21385 [Rhizobiales bacterium]|nr:hypothetical protein [Hyphomicrobiales bacterium]